MLTPTYPVTPLRQIAIILAHCILRIRNKRSSDSLPILRTCSFGLCRTSSAPMQLLWLASPEHRSDCYGRCLVVSELHEFHVFEARLVQQDFDLLDVHSP